MEMVERYLEAVRFWLPKGQKDDIIDELSADIDAQIEEREAVLGDRLSEAEIESILKKRGRPVVVANRFLPQEQLIGPLLFPIYRFVLKIICLGYLVPWAMVVIAVRAYFHVYSAQQTLSPQLAAVASAWGTWWNGAISAVVVVTVVFAILERVEARSHFLDEWSPRNLPPIRIPNRIPRTNSIFELAFASLFFVFWAFRASPHVLNLGSAVRIELSQEWVYFFSAYLVLAAGNAALAAFNLIHPYWTVRRALLRLLGDCAGAALFCWLLRVHIVSSISGASLTVEKSLFLTHAINHWMGQAFPWAIVSSVILASVGIYRVIRVKPPDSSSP